MKCPSCKAGPGELVDMAPGRKLGVVHCLSEHCRAAVVLNDLGYRPFPIPLAEPSPLRVPEPGGSKPVIPLCQWAPCGMPLFSENPKARYHTECGKAANTAASNALAAARRARRRPVASMPSQRCAWGPCSVEFVPVWAGQTFHAQTCSEANHQANRRSSVSQLLEAAGVPSESGWHHQDGGA
jgi:hypothetical protein